MTYSAGTVTFTVEAETEKLLSSNKVIDSSVDKTKNSFKKLDTQVTKTASAVRQAILEAKNTTVSASKNIEDSIAAVSDEMQDNVQASSKMASSAQDLEVRQARLQRILESYTSSLKKNGQTVSANGVVLDQYGKKNELATSRIARMNTELKTSQLRLSKFGRNAGQAGIQVQQFIGQIQGGQSAMLALSQQSADLGFVLGAPLLGAVVGISASLVGMLIPDLTKTTTSLEDVEKATEQVRAAMTLSSSGIANYSEEMKRLAMISEALARVKLATLIADQQRAMETAADGIGKSLDDIQGSFTTYRSLVKQVFGDTTAEAYKSMSELRKVTENLKINVNSESIEAAQVALVNANEAGINNTKTGSELAKTLTGLIAQYKIGAINIDDFRKQLDKAKLSLDDQGAGAGKLTNKYNNLVTALEVQADTLGMSRSEALKYNKALALNQAKVDKQSQSVKNSIAASYDRQIAYAKETEATKAQTDADNKAKTAKDKLDSSKKQAVNKADKLIYSADNRFQKLEKEREDIKADYDKRLIDKQKFDEAMAALDAKNADAADYIKGDSSPLSGGSFDDQYARYAAEEKAEQERYQKQIDRLNEAKAAQIEVIGGYQSLEEDMLREHNSRIAQIEQAKNDSMLSSGATLFGGMADMLSAFGGESSKAYQTIFAISKGFAIAQAAMNLTSAISQAMADPSALTPAQKFANMAAISAAGAGLASQIASVSYSGGRLYGGPVSSSGMYRINENGAPEIFNASNGQQYMLPNTRGEVVSNKDAIASQAMIPNPVSSYTQKAGDSNTSNQTVNNTNININVASDGSTTSDAEGQWGMIASKVVDLVRVEVKQNEANSMRPGGALWNAKQKGR